MIPKSRAKRREAKKAEVASKKPVKQPRRLSDSPGATYMREYRKKVPKGHVAAPRVPKITEQDIEWAKYQRDLGRTYRSIAADLGVDHSYLARRLKRTS